MTGVQWTSLERSIRTALLPMELLGTTEKKVTNYQCKLTYHEERDCQVYEISFDVGRTHYKYVFRATDCDIIENTKEIGDK